MIDGCHVNGFLSIGLGVTQGVITDSVATGCTIGILCSEGLVNGCVAQGNTQQNLTLVNSAISVDTYAP